MGDPTGAEPASRTAPLSDRFTADLRAGRSPTIEAYLGGADAALRPSLLRDLIARELEYRRARGEWPTAEEYERRFPDQPAAVLDAFSGTVLPGAPPAGAATFLLTVTDGPHKGQTFPFADRDVVLLGRSKKAHLNLSEDGLLSRVHFMVEANGASCRLSDMNSHNGTFVNGQRVTTTELSDGDQIKAGKSVLTFAVRREPAAPVTDEVPTLVAAPAPTGGSPGGGTTAPAARPARSGPVGPEFFPRLPGYTIVGELGSGGMGTVFLATRESDGRQVAVKVVEPAVAPGRNMAERFLREVRILSQLRHENIVAFYETDQVDGRFYFSMEYIDGSDAARLLRAKGPLPVKTAVRIACQALAGLGYAHAKGFVHRDVKPANLLIDETGGRKTVKVADFGLARTYQASHLSGLTLDRDIGGTLAFMPPEHVTHFREVGPAADQYGTAATLYHLLTDRHLFDPAPQTPVITQILEMDPVPLWDRRPDVPPDLAVIVHRALAKDPAARFPDVWEFRTALKPFGQ